MSEIVMCKPKKVGESATITDIGDEMLVIGKPTVAYNPITKQNEKVKDIIKTDKQTFCPKCKKQNPSDVEITILETRYFVYACPSCNQFVWVKYE